MNTAIHFRRVLLAGGALALAACATVPPPPTDALQAADISITNAENDHAADYAPLEMRTAHEKLSAARADSQQSDAQMVMRARPLADEARAEADLASAKAHLAKAEAINLELQKNGNALRNEIQRGSGG
jgi:hypothetical protein